MKTVSAAHFGWSRSKVKAMRSASKAEIVVFVAKIHGVQRRSTIDSAASRLAGSGGPATACAASRVELQPYRHAPQAGRPLAFCVPQLRTTSTLWPAPFLASLQSGRDVTA